MKIKKQTQAIQIMNLLMLLPKSWKRIQVTQYPKDFIK